MADLIGAVNGAGSTSGSASFDWEAKLNNIEELLKSINNYSQTTAQEATNPGNYSDWRDVGTRNYPNRNHTPNFSSWRRSSNVGNRSFGDGVEDAIYQAMGLDDIRDSLNATMTRVAERFGVEVSDLPGELGHSFGEAITNALNQNTNFNRFSSMLRASRDRAFERFNEEFEQYTESLRTGEFPDDPTAGIREVFSDIRSELSDAGQQLQGFVSELPDDSRIKGFASRINDFVDSDRADAIRSRATDFAQNAASRLESTQVGQVATQAVAKLANGPLASVMGGAVSTGLRGALAASGGSIGLAVELVAAPIIEHVTDILGQIADKVGRFIDALGKASDRDVATRQKKLEEGQERLFADIKIIVETPFKILEEAADKVYEVWDNALTTINQTQGYSKSELQSLIGNYAERLRSEGLEAVVSSADITSNLKKVLESGLSGQVAEEFAYIATKLNSAIPTQDFFQYGTAYASLAANLIKSGSSQADAIAYANQQLELFASDILYASRQLTGGFSTGLKDASDLFQKAIEISTAARTNNPSDIAGVLTSISSMTEAIAPGIGSSIVEAVYNAAVGGNSSEIVALRSLAGINASNTEFLRQIAQDPKGIFSTLFRNLAELQTMSQDNYMEVAEGLQSVFGIDKAAFARLDFAYLADAISNMSVSTASLSDNIDLLASGESTLTKEQMRIRQINEYMMEEGLSYVLDNEVAREVQRHMWDEQIALQITEAEYGVNLRGEALSLLNSLLDIGRNILGFLNPVTMITKLVNLTQTTFEAITADDRVEKILRAGRVGGTIDLFGNQTLRNMTTYGQDLHLTNDYLQMLISERLKTVPLALKSLSNMSSSYYKWGQVSKSAAKSLGTIAKGVTNSSNIGYSLSYGSPSQLTNAAIEQNAQLEQIQERFDRMQSTMSNFFGNTVYDQMQTKLQDLISQNMKSSHQDFTALAEHMIDTDENLRIKYGLEDPRYTSTLSTINSDYAKTSANLLREVAIKQIADQLEKEYKDSVARDTKNRTWLDRLTNKGIFAGVSSGYTAWANTADTFGFTDFTEELKEIGITNSNLQSYFETLETQASTQAELDRKAAEERFWENSQLLLETLNVNVHDVFDKGDIMGVFWPGIDSWFALIHSSLEDFKGKWYDEYFVRYLKNHETYSMHFGAEFDEEGNAVGGSENYLQMLEEVKAAQADSEKDVINALAEAITNIPIDDLMDPTVQQNVFLAQILTVVQGIFQQNNTQGKLKLPDAIAALATGMVAQDSTSASDTASTTGSAATTV